MPREHTGGYCNNEQREEFLRLFACAHASLFQYILCHVPNWANAEDLQQETELRLWEQFDRYEQGTNFLAWAKSIAHYQVLTFRKQQQRNRTFQFTEEVFDSLESHIRPDSSDQQEKLSKALHGCVEKLAPKNKELLRRCYGGKSPIKDIARDGDRNPNAVYKAISRIRVALRKCILKSLGE